MEFNNQNYKKNEILKKIGDISQLASIKTYKFIDGKSNGLRAVDIKNAVGLDFTILLDRGMDIPNLSYKGIPISWRSAIGETSPIFYESRGTEWMRTFFGGLLTTCGLNNIGAPCVDDDEELGMHGRISNLSSENVNINEEWINDEYIMRVKGKIREVRLFGEKLELRRKITTWIDKPKILLEDEVENFGFEDYPLMILYHINIGFPIVDKNSLLIEPKAKVITLDEESKKNFDGFNKFSEPYINAKNLVFYHDIEIDEDGYSNVAIINKEFNNNEGIGFWLKYNKNNLPYLVHWKRMGMGEYVCAVEPANSLLRGRDIERKENNLKFIKPNEKIKYSLEFNILTSNKDIEEIENKFRIK